MNDNKEVSKTNSDSLKYDFDTSIYAANGYELQCIGKDINGISDTTKFAIVVRPDQVNQVPPNGIKPGINYINSSTVTLASSDSGYVGTDLSDDHPVGFTYDATLVAADKELTALVPPATRH